MKYATCIACTLTGLSLALSVVRPSVTVTLALAGALALFGMIGCALVLVKILWPKPRTKRVIVELWEEPTI